MRFFVYLITNLVNGKVYVGKAWNVCRRWSHHKYQAKTGQLTLLHKAIRKYGIDSFRVETLLACDDEESAYAAEVREIAQRRSMDPSVGYNRTTGGDGTRGCKVADATREKQRAAKLGRVASEAERAKQSFVARMQKGKHGIPISVNQAHLLSGWGLTPWGLRYEKRDVAGLPSELSTARTSAKRFCKGIMIAISKKGVKQSASSIGVRAEKIRGQRRTEGQLANLRAAAAKRHADNPGQLARAQRASTLSRTGEPLTTEHRAAIGDALRGRTIWSTEERAEISRRLTGHVVTQDTRDKIAASHRDRTKKT